MFDPYRWWYMYGKKKLRIKKLCKAIINEHMYKQQVYKQQVRAVFLYTPYMYLSIGIDPVLNR